MMGFEGCLVLPFDKDFDTTPDYIDLDSDNDGEFDLIEGHDFNGDRFITALDNPTANTGIHTILIDIDMDGLLDGYDNNLTLYDATNLNMTPLSHSNFDHVSVERDWREDFFLPVELLFFTLNLESSNSVILNWSTSSETDNKGFEIEHALPSETTLNFENIGFVEGQGTTLDLPNYDFQVNDLIEGTHYFRLKQIDNYGGYTYSETKVLTIAGLTAAVKVFPNPSNGGINIEINKVYQEEIKVSVFDNIGQQVRGYVFYDQNAIRLDLSSLPTAVYHLRVETFFGRDIFKLIIKRN